MAKASKKALLKTRKKRWFTITAPSAYREIVLGEIPAYEPEELVNKTVTVNLMFLLNDPKKQNAKISFRILGIADNKITTAFDSYEVLPSFVRRIVRRGKCRIDESIVIKSKDDAFLRIKPLVLTHGLTTSAVKKQLHKKLREHMHRKVQTSTVDELVSDILSNKLQIGMKAELNKIFPIASCEIRALRRAQAPVGYKDMPLPSTLLTEQLPQGPSAEQQSSDEQPAGNPPENTSEQQAA